MKRHLGKVKFLLILEVWIDLDLTKGKKEKKFGGGRNIMKKKWAEDKGRYEYGCVGQIMKHFLTLSELGALSVPIAPFLPCLWH